MISDKQCQFFSQKEGQNKVFFTKDYLSHPVIEEDLKRFFFIPCKNERGVYRITISRDSHIYSLSLDRRYCERSDTFTYGLINGTPVHSRLHLQNIVFSVMGFNIFTHCIIPVKGFYGICKYYEENINALDYLLKLEKETGLSRKMVLEKYFNNIHGFHYVLLLRQHWVENNLVNSILNLEYYK